VLVTPRNVKTTGLDGGTALEIRKKVPIATTEMKIRMTPIPLRIARLVVTLRLNHPPPRLPTGISRK
jgi:hypothetical protein